MKLGDKMKQLSTSNVTLRVERARTLYNSNKADFSEILTDIKKNSKGDIDDITIIANWTQETINKSEKNIPDGTYTVGDRIVTIKDKTVIDVG